MSELLKHAPIFWFHGNEKYFPIGVDSFVEIADLYKKKRNVPFNHTSGELKDLGEDHSLVLPGVDMNGFDTEQYGSGPDAVARLVYEMSQGFFGKHGYKVYWRRNREAIEIKTADPGSPYLQEMKEPDPSLIGTYDIIQFFPFYIFNDFWNKHVGDWDSTVEIINNKQKNRAFLRTSLHEASWLMQIPLQVSNKSFDKWIKEWKENPNGRYGLEPVFTLRGHPFIFVACGSHAAYPTPGYTLWGPPTVDLLTASDERQFGQICLIPQDGNAKKQDILNFLKGMGLNIDSQRIKQYQIKLGKYL